MGSFVGRRRELAELRAAVDALVAGRGGLFLIGGEPGIGKTRLAEHALESAAASGVPVVWGRCVELEGVPPYWPWVQVLRAVSALQPDAVRLPDPAAAAALARLLPELDAASAGGAAGAGADQRFLLFEAAAQVFRSATAARPLAVVLDDLQWSDAGSLALLRHLAGEVHALRLLVIATYRDVQLGRRGPLAAALPELAREPGTRRLRLQGLEETDVAEYLAGDGQSDPALARAVHEQAGGNPFYVGEIGRLLSVEGRLGAWTLPEGVREVVGRRLDHLSEECRRALAAASVLGREFDVELLAALTGVERSSLLPLIDEAEADALIRRGSPRTYAFAHDLIREFLYQDLPTRTRLLRHHQVAEILERSNPPASLPELAHHWYEAGGEASWEKAVEYAARAAAEAMEQLAYEEAARLLGMALESLPLKTSDPLRRWRLLHDLALAQYRAGLMRDSLASCVDAARAARELHRGDLEAKSVLVIQDVADAAVHPALQALCESALASAGDRYPALRAQLLAQLARILDTVGRPERNDALSREAVELAELSRDADALVAAIYARHTVASLPEGIGERRHLGTSLIEIAAGGGPPSHAAWGHLWRIDAGFQSGDLASVPSEIADLEVVVDRLRQPLFKWHLLRTQAALAQATGGFEEALSFNDEALRAWGPAHHAMTGVFHRWFQGAVGLELGRPELMEPARALHELVQPPMRPSFAILSARMELGLGHDDRARELLDESLAWLSASPPGRQSLMVAALLAEIATATGTPEQQSWLHGFLAPHGRLFIASGAGAVACFGSVARVAGMLDAALGRLGEAAEELEEAITANRRAGAAPYTAHAQLELARVKAQQGRAAEAAELARAAGRTAQRLGMRPLGAAAARLAKELERHLPRLSRREAEVAGMIARGLSNREIAESMHLSVRTVENHVQRVLDKLGFTSRTQIAAWAVANRLLSRAEIEYLT